MIWRNLVSIPVLSYRSDFSCTWWLLSAESWSTRLSKLLRTSPRLNAAALCTLTHIEHGHYQSTIRKLGAIPHRNLLNYEIEENWQKTQLFVVKIARKCILEQFRFVVNFEIYILCPVNETYCAYQNVCVGTSTRGKRTNNNLINFFK